MTQFTSGLGLALPVTGELTGTWGDVVNDQITALLEQAVAGRTIIDSWAGNAHTLTVADGAADEARSAMLTLTDSMTQLTGTGTVIVPDRAKIYFVENLTTRAILFRTASGTATSFVASNERQIFVSDGVDVRLAVTVNLPDAIPDGTAAGQVLRWGGSSWAASSIILLEDNIDTGLTVRLPNRTFVDDDLIAARIGIGIPENADPGARPARELDISGVFQHRFNNTPGDLNYTWFNYTAVGQYRINVDAQNEVGTSSFEIATAGNTNLFVRTVDDSAQARIGINTNNPLVDLHVVGQIDPVALRLQEIGATEYLDLSFENDREGRIRIQRTGIGQFHINFQGTDYFTFEDNGDFTMTRDFVCRDIDSARNGTFTGDLTVTGTINNPSDIRWKENIETLDGNKLLEMRGVSFTRNGKASSGVIAQELRKVAPELVTENDEGYLYVQYGNMVGYIIENAKRQEAYMISLHERIERLETRLGELENS